MLSLATAKGAALLTLLAEDEGFTPDELVRRFCLSGVQPGICRDCHATTARCEPDAADNWCHECEGQTVASVGVLAGFI